MNHERAFALVEKYAPGNIGMLWNTTLHSGCNTAWAVADQYDDDETDAAVSDLMTLANGKTPDSWEAV